MFHHTNQAWFESGGETVLLSHRHWRHSMLDTDSHLLDIFGALVCYTVIVCRAVFALLTQYMLGVIAFFDRLFFV